MREERTNTATSALTFDKDCLIYCASLWPEAGEENVWRRRTFQENYTSVARIHRPKAVPKDRRQFHRYGVMW